MTMLSGGCQCGAVRFSCDSDKLESASICHCRMCQKAFGSYYAPLVAFRRGAVTWTRGTPKRFRSSNFVERGFCADCGTPLTYEFVGHEPSIAAGAFDQPEALPPVLQYGVEAILSFVDSLPSLPREATGDLSDAAGSIDPLVSFQHPDHDTAVWPPEKE